jgi:cyanophycinase
MKKQFLICGIITLCQIVSAANKRGQLLIIGGGDKPLTVLQQFVAQSHNKPILIITSASSDAREAGEDMVQQLAQAGCSSSSWRHLDTPAIANSDSIVEMIERAGAVFFTGGDQDRLMNRLLGTRAEKAILQLYFDKAGVIGGTSAGAAVMSRVMITGNELINKDSTNIFTSVQAKNVETKRGFGFLDQVIIDQHFAMRKRHNRLISVVLEHPELPGIGINEDTAIWVYPNLSFCVYGEGPVIIYDARHARSVRCTEAGKLGGKNLKVDVLLPGDIGKIE